MLEIVPKGRNFELHVNVSINAGGVSPIHRFPIDDSFICGFSSTKRRGLLQLNIEYGDRILKISRTISPEQFDEAKSRLDSFTNELYVKSEEFSAESNEPAGGSSRQSLSSISSIDEEEGLPQHEQED